MGLLDDDVRTAMVDRWCASMPTRHADRERDLLPTMRELQDRVGGVGDGERSPLANPLLFTCAMLVYELEGQLPDGRADGGWTPPAPDDPYVIAVFDREGDIFEAIETLGALGHGFVIRAVRDRKLKEPVGEMNHSFAAVESAPELGRVPFEVPRRGSQPARLTTLTLRGVKMTLLPPKNRGRKGMPLQIGMVLIQEATPPEDGAEPVCWYLLTSEPCETLDDALRVVTYYRFRWRVEEFHMGLKTGCGVERVQFKTMHALTNYLAMATVASWRLLALRDAARSGEPDVPPEILSEREKHILRQQFPRLPQSPTARDWLVAVAKLGGFFGRKSDGDPGWRTLCWGWKRLKTIQEGWELAHRNSGYR